MERKKTVKIWSEAHLYFFGHMLVEFLWSLFLLTVTAAIIITNTEAFSLNLLFSSLLMGVLSILFILLSLRNLRNFKKASYWYKTKKQK